MGWTGGLSSCSVGRAASRLLHCVSKRTRRGRERTHRYRWTRERGRSSTRRGKSSRSPGDLELFPTDALAPQKACKSAGDSPTLPLFSTSNAALHQGRSPALPFPFSAAVETGCSRSSGVSVSTPNAGRAEVDARGSIVDGGGLKGDLHLNVVSCLPTHHPTLCTR
jgi:hypothetical protein